MSYLLDPDHSGLASWTKLGMAVPEGNGIFSFEDDSLSDLSGALLSRCHPVNYCVSATCSSPASGALVVVVRDGPDKIVKAWE